MTLNSVIKQNKEIPTTELDGEIGFLSVEIGKYFSANPVGNSIWNIIEVATSVNDIVQRLLEQYDVTQEECESDVLEFLGDMEKKNLIEVE